MGQLVGGRLHLPDFQDRRWGHGDRSAEVDGRAIQRCLPVHGLVADCAAAADRDLVGHEVGSRDLQFQGHYVGRWVGLDDRQRVLRRTQSESDPQIKSKIQLAQLVTVISWCTYPIVYLFPMFGITAGSAVVGIQIGYCASDIISKCGVGLMIYQITYAKSSKEGLLG